MQNQFLRASSALLVVAGLYGCSKTADTIKPQAQAVTAQDAVTMPSVDQQNKWLYYLELLEQGKVTDPTKQYVAKGVYVDAEDNDDAQDKGEDRPKYDAYNGQADWGFSTYVANGGQFDTPKAKGCADCLLEASSVGETGAGPSVAARFDNSVGLGTYTGVNNPNGDIYDVKVVKGSSSNLSPLSGYTIIPLDLNKGAGGQYIYLMFTRDPSKVKYGDEIKGANQGYNNGYRVVGPVRKMSSFSQRVGAVFTQGFTAWHGAVPTWAQWVFGQWKQPDLNDGAGGRFIYGFQGKGDNDGAPVEIGVLSGNSSRIAPPAGWRKIDGSNPSFPGVDLNEGAGGDYIYFCIKTR